MPSLRSLYDALYRMLEVIQSRPRWMLRILFGWKFVLETERARRNLITLQEAAERMDEN